MSATKPGRWVILLLTVATLGLAGRDTALLDAVKRADSAALRALLQQQSVDVNTPEADGTTALHWAVHLDRLDMVDQLIQAGANVGATNRYGVAPLLLASTNGNAAVIERLLTAGADPNTALPEGETALMTAARTGKVDALQVLLAHGARVDVTEGWRGQTALMWAASENHPAAVRALLDASADLDARSTGGFTPLMFAVRAGHPETVRVLLDAGANVNETLPDGNSVLHLAVINAHYELAAWLLDRGADPNAHGPGWTPLHQLMWTRRPNGNNRGIIPPVPTGTLDTIGLATALLAHGADINARETKEPADGHRWMGKRIGATPFLLAAKASDAEMMRFLAAKGADPLMPTAENTTPLMVAAGVGIWQVGENPGTNEEALEAVKVALELGGDVNAVDDNGETALHGAAYRGANELVKFLVDNGANMEVENKDGWTPLKITEGVWYPNTFNPKPETEALLRQLGAQPTDQSQPERQERPRR